MKYFIIVLFLIGFFGLAFAYPGEEVEISVSTDKKSYKPGEILTIKGTGAHSYSIWAKIISPEGDEIIELKFLAPISGEFYTAWIIPKTIAPGLYSVVARDIVQEDEANFEILGSSEKLRPLTEFIKEKIILPPLKQIKAGVALVDVICNEGKVPAYKYHAMRVACVSLETESQLVLRGWALLRLHMYDDDPSRALCERYNGNWLTEHRECEYISPQQCSLMGGEFSECESACRNDPTAEICTLQCVLVCSIEGNHFPEFGLTFSREGGIAGITQSISIDTQNNLIEVSGFNSKTLGPISTEDMQLLWDIISENQFFELDSVTYPPVEGSADYFTYTLDVVTSPKSNTITWTDTSEKIPDSVKTIAQHVESIVNQKECESTDGKWGIWSNYPFVSSTCNPTTSDVGKECADSSKCQSFCQAKEGSVIDTEDTGMCYGFELAICMQEVRNGFVDPEWCQ